MGEQRRTGTGIEARAGPRVLVVVERGRDETYRRLRAELEAGGEATVTWDRRGPERRWERVPPPGGERRGRDRRGPPPASWVALGFLLAPADGGGAAPVRSEPPP